MSDPPGPFQSQSPQHPLSAPDDAFWTALNQMTAETVRHSLGLQIWNERKQKLAREWLAHRESSQGSAENAAILAEARAANDLARQANDSASEANVIARSASASARRTADAARTSNRIAAAALAAAMIAVVVSIIGLAHTGSHADAPKIRPAMAPIASTMSRGPSSEARSSP